MALIFAIFALFILITGLITYLYRKKRVAKFENVAMDMGFDYTHHLKDTAPTRQKLQDRGYKLFSKGKRRKVSHNFDVPFQHGWLSIMEYVYEIDTDESGEYLYHVIVMESEQLPATQLTIEKKKMRHRIAPKIGFKEQGINFEMYPDFAKRYYVQGEDEAAVRALVSHDLITWFMQLTTPYEIEVIPHGFIMYQKGRLRVNELDQLKIDGMTLHNLLVQSPKSTRDADGWDNDNQDWWEAS